MDRCVRRDVSLQAALVLVDSVHQEAYSARWTWMRMELEFPALPACSFFLLLLLFIY